MIETNVTFSGQEAEKIFSAQELTTFIEMLNAGGAPQIERISHNCDIQRLIKVLDAKQTTGSNPVASLYGIKIYKAPYIPRGEIWMQDKDGKVIRKVFLPTNL